MKLWFQNWNWNYNLGDYGSRTGTGTVITSGYWNNTNKNVKMIHDVSVQTFCTGSPK